MSDSPPKVLIVGAGLAGLFLAILLERANIPYHIFERAAKVKQLGAVLVLDASILAVFEQLGLFDDLMAISFPVRRFRMFHGDMSVIAEFSPGKDIKKLVGYDYIVFPRPDLYDLLLTKVPTEKISFGKKILSLQQNAYGVMIRIADNTTFHGDILVGADGANSGVRQSLYKELLKKRVLPKSDGKQCSVDYSSMVGTTNPLGEDFHPDLKVPINHNAYMIGKGTPYTWSTYTVPGNRICWSVQIQLEAKTSEDETFRNSEWNSDANQGLINEIRTFKTPYGDLGQLIDATDKDLISRVHLEHKLFETWHHNRAVLIGDAAHKLLPSSGQGAVNALQDAVVLANCLYDLTSVTPEGITAAFQDFKDQRYPHVMAQYEVSIQFAKVWYGQTMRDRIVRRMVLNYLPELAKRSNLIKKLSYRPQAAFLPQVPNHGISKVLPQKPSWRYTELQKKKDEAIIEWDLESTPELDVRELPPIQLRPVSTSYVLLMQRSPTYVLPAEMGDLRFQLRGLARILQTRVAMRATIEQPRALQMAQVDDVEGEDDSEIEEDASWMFE
ncbi:hypothetical protein BGZ75_003511 [Mortierella antarctica]|nr:hypothetical protein BGZ75_003511 [Mortierella antarctica]